MPLELQIQVIGYLDGASTARAAKASRSMAAIVKSHPDYTRTMQAGALMKRLEADLAREGRTPDAATLGELRACAPFLAPEQVQTIVRLALTERDYAHEEQGQGMVLGVLIHTVSDGQANQIAAQLDRVSSRSHGNRPQEEADRAARSKVLADVLGSIGEARPAVYAPFVERLRSATYDAMSADLCLHFGDMPRSVCDDICAAVLTKERETGPNGPEYEQTLQMFVCLKHLSPEMQESVFVKATQVRDAIPPGDDRDWMSTEFAVGSRSRDEVFESLPPDIRDKWQDLFAA